MKLQKIVLILVFIISFNSCKDVIFDNPFDPNASVEGLKLIKVIPTSLRGKGDICFDGEKIWKISEYGNLIAFDIETGIIIRTIQSIKGTGLCFFRDKIYVCNGENILYFLDSLSGDIIGQNSTTDICPAYLCAIDGFLIIYDLRSTSFFKYNPETGDSIRLFQASGINIGGIEIYKEGILVSDMNSGSIYHFFLNGEIKNVFRSPVNDITGLTVDANNYIYLFTLDGKINKVSIP